MGQEKKPEDKNEPVSEGDADFSSSACQMHEADPAYFGYMNATDLLVLLNTLLEGERAGVRATSVLRKSAGTGNIGALVRTVANDEASCCAMLDRHITRLGGIPSPSVGKFFDKFVEIDGLRSRLEFLNRGQEWVIRRLREDIPKVADEPLRSDLTEMLKVHETNVSDCSKALLGMPDDA